MKEAITRAFEESIQAKRAFLKENLSTLMSAIDAVAEAFLRGNKFLIFGNGGSAADAQHIAAEFVNRFRIERPPLPALALTTDTSAITSIANDYDYKEIFSKQVKALGKEGDVALAISTSGNAANVLAAIEVCKKLKIATIGLTGGDGGKMARQVDYLLRVSEGKNTARIQETHILVGHVICELVDQKLFSA
ncbi:MAG: D-sedoheptulose 7-phosphate isomerase [Deltaproteobacteria bacterium]|nr:D-sedoheptulose 7-phosphate isomerase [Deltaproteobacteria bacterium]MBI2210162.1 D-sedoheptulose 7-phosphate isomerase [Deltaproteobacteria bacterium]MBI2348535.1 D-sedoheptulose 7-phosphate isomerase [Deltaproteobacteria bacterium]MBI2539912.1 D-sedoheptulose 7-phosphate isomerase [Deltaproteobacteria bacterium]MBI2992167.1 D-sedoheptulose 7-phosphate isomerase [Deltaproteobacteria bacterium]